MVRTLVVLIALLLAPAAQAQPTALGRSEGLALSGGAAIVAHANSRTATIRRVPLDGAAPTVLYSAEVPVNRRASFEVAASDQRVGAIVTLAGRKSGFLKSAQVLTGPPDGPLTPAGAPVDLTSVAATGGPNTVYAASDTVFVEDDQGAVTTYAPDGTRGTLTLPDEISSLDFAGDLVAFGQRTARESEEDPPTRLLLRNWRTGETLRDLELPAGLIRLDLRADGSALLELDGPTYELTAAGALTRLSYDASTPTVAGDRTVVLRHDNQGEFDRLVVIEPGDTARHAVGLPGRAIEDFLADPEHVVWQSNGCAFSSALDDPAAVTFTNDAGCKDEPYVVTQIKRQRLSRTVRIRVGCLNAANGICGTDLRGEEFRPVPLAVPAGRRETFTVRLRAKAFRKLRRERYRVIHITSPPGFPILLEDGPRTRG